jgi:HSP20 family protein
VQQGWNRIFNEFLPRPHEHPFRREEPGAKVWAPAVDVFETDSAMVLKVEVAGVDPEDIEVRVENHTLFLKGQRKVEKEGKGEKYHHLERQSGSFARSFTLPRTVDAQQAAAEYREGILTLTLPKKEEAKPKTIKVSVAGVN